MITQDLNNTLRLAREELARRMLFERYQREPLFWLKDRFKEDPKFFQWSLWGDEYEKHTWDGDIDPLATAWGHLANNNWVGLESATGTGKTFWLARVVFWFLDCFEGSLVVTSAPVAAQLKTQLWSEMKTAFHKFKKIRPHAHLFDSLRLLVDARGFDELADEEQNMQAWQAIGVASRASSGSQSNTSRQGFHRKDMLIIVEETPGIDFASIEAYKNTSTGGNNRILAVGNPDSQLDPLHVFCESPNVKAVRISGYDAPNTVLGKEVVPGAVTRGSIEKRRTESGEESNIYKSRVRGISPAQSVDSLIRLEWIENSLVDYFDGSAVGAVGVDVANSEGGDKASVAFGKGNTLVQLFHFQCPNASHLAYNMLYDSSELEEKKYLDYKIPKLHTYNIKPNYVGIDGVGVGVSTVNAFNDELKSNEKVISLQGGALKNVIPTDNEGKPLYAFGNLRAQMYWDLREDLRQGKLNICLQDKTILQELKRELVAPKWIGKGNKIEVESKDAIKKRLGNSPNLADAVVYWNWIRKGYYAPKNSIFDYLDLDVGL